jgi:hypothetical protein
LWGEGGNMGDKKIITFTDAVYYATNEVLNTDEFTKAEHYDNTQLTALVTSIISLIDKLCKEMGVKWSEIEGVDLEDYRVKE